MAKNNKSKKKKPLISWISKNHRMVVVNDQTFVEEKSWSLHPTNVLFFIATIIIGIMLFTMLLVKFTPLGRLVTSPKEAVNNNLRVEMDKLLKQLDTLNTEIAENSSFMESIQKVTLEDFEYEEDMKKQASNILTETGIKTYEEVPEKSADTKELLEAVEMEREFGSLVNSLFLEGEDRIDRSSFVAPVNGVVSDTFSPIRSHYGTDIVAPKSSVIKAIRNGTIIMSTWSVETGHMLGIQHDNNLVSWYKHNSARLKVAGDRVDAGEAIAIIGNSGEMTDGPHLHFELWYNGQPVDPQNYIDF